VRAIWRPFYDPLPRDATETMETTLLDEAGEGKLWRATTYIRAMKRIFKRSQYNADYMEVLKNTPGSRDRVLGISSKS
jgi:hypothetical protein